MPAYPWFVEDDLDVSLIQKKISAMRTLGVPYTDEDEKSALNSLNTQAEFIAREIVDGYPAEAKKLINVEDRVAELKKKEVVAIIAYLQRLGTDIQAKNEVKTDK